MWSQLNDLHFQLFWTIDGDSLEEYRAVWTIRQVPQYIDGYGQIKWNLIYELGENWVNFSQVGANESEYSEFLNKVEQNTESPRSRLNLPK